MFPVAILHRSLDSDMRCPSCGSCKPVGLHRSLGTVRYWVQIIPFSIHILKPAGLHHGSPRTVRSSSDNHHFPSVSLNQPVLHCTLRSRRMPDSDNTSFHPHLWTSRYPYTRPHQSATRTLVCYVQVLFPCIEDTTSIAIAVAPSDYAIDFFLFSMHFRPHSGRYPLVTVRTGVPVTLRIIREFQNQVYRLPLGLSRSFRTVAFQDCLRCHTVSFCLIQCIQKCFVHSYTTCRWSSNPWTQLHPGWLSEALHPSAPGYSSALRLLDQMQHCSFRRLRAAQRY